MHSAIDNRGEAVPNKNKVRTGVYSGIGAGLIWGIYPFIYKPLAGIDILEVISHRVIWSVVFLLPITVLISKKGGLIKKAIANRKDLLTIFMCSLILAGWWLTYIYTLVNDRILEAGLGYYLGPVMTAMLGIVLLKEKADYLSVASVVISFIGILYYAIQTQGQFPIYGIMLGLFYSGYTIFKRGYLKVDSQASVTLEFCILIIPSVLYLLWKFVDGSLSTFVITTNTQNMLLIFIGIMNVIPMVMYSYASTNVPSITMSFIQYISPTCNFLLAVLYYNEPFGHASLVMFAAIWIGVIIFCYRQYSLMRVQSLTLKEGANGNV